MLMFSFVPAKAHRWAMLLGVLTATFCLLVADGFFGLFSPNSTLFWRYTFPGMVIYWAALLGLPILFRKKVRWRDTWVNFFLYLLLFFLFRPIPHALGIVRHSKYLRFGGGEFFSIPGSTVLTALQVSLRLFLVQGALLFAFEAAAAWRAEKRTAKDLKDLVHRVPSWVKYALLLAVLTDVFALFIADGIFGLRSAAGIGIFLIAVFGLPCFFAKKVRWLQSGIGIPVHVAGYFLLRYFWGDATPFILLADPFRPEYQPIFHRSNFTIGEFVAVVIWIMQCVPFYFTTPRGWWKKET